MSLPDLSGKVAFITGGGTGIGAGIARAFAGAGASVAIVGRRSEVLESTVEMIQKDGGRGVAVPSDVTDLDKLSVAVDDVVARLGGLDIVVANAGGPPLPGPVLDMSADDWKQTIDLNLNGVWNTAKATVPHLLDNGGGHLLVIGSCAGRSRNGETVGAYGAAKAGVSQLSRVLAWELAQSSIAVNEITPGLTTTPGIGVVEGVVPDYVEDAARGMGEWLKDPDDVGQFALYLVGLPTNGTTGQRFELDRNR
jgi:NAD(P)-dependent dehydrogenase (short-subunit alcohol dehydrogenase family)